VVREFLRGVIQGLKGVGEIDRRGREEKREKKKRQEIREEVEKRRKKKKKNGPELQQGSASLVIVLF